nr:hypothetical protein BdHM001_32060 [Bdellovibrio sp. HM001]
MAGNIETSAELLVAAKFRENGWEIYFPHKDDGFDFVAYKKEKKIFRPVQVKGKYRESSKDKTTYGYKGSLSHTHSDMVLAVVFFNKNNEPLHFAYLKYDDIKFNKNGDAKAEVCCIKDNKIKQRRDFSFLFGLEGINRLIE